MSTIGEKIKEMRLQRGFTQSELASGFVTPSMISQIEADRAKPSFPLLMNIATRLGLPVDYFMDEIDQQAFVYATIDLSTYYASIDKPDIALQILANIDEPEVFSVNYPSYGLLKAKCLRMMAQFDASVSLLETLREQSYRTQDKRLLFYVCKESGYVEYDAKNMVGAMHEWRKAIVIGKELLASDQTSTLFLQGDMTEVLILLDELTEREHQETESPSPFLQEALQWTENTQALKSISAALIEEATKIMKTDTPRAKLLTEKAIALQDSARWIEQSIYVQTKLAKQQGEIPTDPWIQNALAITSIHPFTFVATECTRIADKIEKKQPAHALQMIDRCYDILNEATQDNKNLYQTTFAVRVREMFGQLRIYEGEALRLQGDAKLAIQKLEQFIPSLSEETDKYILSKILAHLILWYHAMGDKTHIFELNEQLHQLWLLPDKPLMVNDI